MRASAVRIIRTRVYYSIGNYYAVLTFLEDGRTVNTQFSSSTIFK